MYSYYCISKTNIHKVGSRSKRKFDYAQTKCPRRSQRQQKRSVQLLFSYYFRLQQFPCGNLHRLMPSPVTFDDLPEEHLVVGDGELLQGEYRLLALMPPHDCRIVAHASGVQARMVCEELLQPAVRQGMSEQSFDCRKRACSYIGPRIETLDNMLRMTDRSGQHLRFVTIGAVDLHLQPCRAVSRRCGDAALPALHPLAPFLRSRWL